MPLGWCKCGSKHEIEANSILESLNRDTWSSPLIVLAVVVSQKTDEMAKLG